MNTMKTMTRREMIERPLEVGEWIKHASHGGSAMIVSIGTRGITLRHPSGVERINRWTSLFMWRRVIPGPFRKGEISAAIKATRDKYDRCAGACGDRDCNLTTEGSPVTSDAGGGK